MNIKKNIILSSYNGGNAKGFVSFEKSSSGVNGVLKISNLPNGNKVLGIDINGKMFKFNFGGNLVHFTLDDFDFSSKIMCVVLNKENLKQPLLVGSTTLTSKIYNYDFGFDEENSSDKYSNVEYSNIDLTKLELANENEPVEIVKASLNEDNKKEEKVDVFMQEQQEIDDLIDDYIKDDFDEDLEFYNMIKNQVELMLNQNEKEKILEEIIPESKFVTIPKNDGSDYVFGVIFENGRPKYICYGEKGKFNECRPKNLEAYYQWLPIDADDIEGDGYYMMYQDAKTGKNLEMTVLM